MTRSARVLLACSVAFAGVLPPLAAEEPAAGPEAPVPLAGLVPGDALLYLTVPSLEKTWEGFRSLPLYQVYQDEEVQQFLGSVMEGAAAKIPDLNRKAIDALLTLPEVFDGEIAFALLPPVAEPDWVFSASAVKDPEAAGRFLETSLVPFLSGLFPWGPEVEQIGGCTVHGFMGPDRSWYAAAVGGRVLIASSRAALDAVLAGQGRGGEATLAESDAFRAGHKRVEASAGSFFAYVSFDGLWADALANMNDQESETFRGLGIDGMRFLSAGLSMEKGRADDRVFLDIGGEAKGVFKIFSNAKVGVDLARLAPEKTVLLLAATLDMAGFYQTLLQAADSSESSGLRTFRETMDSMTQELGLRSFSDFIDQLGTEILLLVALPEGGGMFPEAVAAVEVLEPDKLQTNIFGLVRTAAGTDPKSASYRGREIYFVPQEGRGSPVELSPCWCVTDGYVLVSYHPNHVKGMIRRIDQGTGSLKNDESFVAAWNQLPAEATAVGYMNSKRLFNYLYSLFLFVAPMMGNELPFDPAMLPAAETVAAYLSFGLTGVTVEEGGIAMATQSDGYGPTSLSLYGLTAGLFAGLFEERNQSLGRHPSCAWYLESCHRALEAYRGVHQTYPPSLDALAAEEAELHWQPFCPKAASEEAAAGGAAERAAVFEYVVTARKIDPPEAFAADAMVVWDAAPRHNGGRMVLLGNGEVVWLPEKEFQRRLAEQE